MKFNGRLLLFGFILVCLTTASKYFFGPNLAWSGFTPVIAIALFSGMIIKDRKFSFLLPLVALFLSDAIIHILFRLDLFDYAGFYSGQWINYSILLISTLIGWMLKGRSYSSLFLGAIAAPTVYFFVSNGLVWRGSEAEYGRDFSGLMTCYAAGLPFFRNALISTMLFFPVILFLYNYLAQRKSSLILA